MRHFFPVILDCIKSFFISLLCRLYSFYYFRGRTRRRLFGRRNGYIRLPVVRPSPVRQGPHFGFPGSTNQRALHPCMPKTLPQLRKTAGEKNRYSRSPHILPVLIPKDGSPTHRNDTTPLAGNTADCLSLQTTKSCFASRGKYPGNRAAIPGLYNGVRIHEPSSQLSCQELAYRALSRTHKTHQVDIIHLLKGGKGDLDALCGALTPPLNHCRIFPVSFRQKPMPEGILLLQRPRGQRIRQTAENAPAFFACSHVN